MFFVNLIILVIIVHASPECALVGTKCVPDGFPCCIDQPCYQNISCDGTRLFGLKCAGEPIKCKPDGRCTDPSIELCTSNPTSSPTFNPIQQPTLMPTHNPTQMPSNNPTLTPVIHPTPQQPTLMPTHNPTQMPTHNPTQMPTNNPTSTTVAPTIAPTTAPTIAPAKSHTEAPYRPVVVAYNTRASHIVPVSALALAAGYCAGFLLFIVLVRGKDLA